MSNADDRITPGPPFLLLGMGPRCKLLYRKGVLRDVRSDEVVRSWPVRSQRILWAGEHRVEWYEEAVCDVASTRFRVAPGALWYLTLMRAINAFATVLVCPLLCPLRARPALNLCATLISNKCDACALMTNNVARNTTP